MKLVGNIGQQAASGSEIAAQKLYEIYVSYLLHVCGKAVELWDGANYMEVTEVFQKFSFPESPFSKSNILFIFPGFMCSL